MLKFYAREMTARVLDKKDLEVMLRLHGYEPFSYASGDRGFRTGMYDFKERYLTREFMECMFEKCGTDIEIKRFPVGIEMELNLREQFIDGAGYTWHEQWFVPGSFKAV